MMRYSSTSKLGYFTVLVMVITMVMTIQACKKGHSDLGKALFTETGNKVYEGVEDDAFAKIFEKTLREKKSGLGNPAMITSFYEKNGFKPVFIIGNIGEKRLQLLPAYLDKAGEHGLDPQLFKSKPIKEMVGKLYDRQGVKTIEEAYQLLARLELLTANSLINYSNALQFGVVSPKRIYAAYYTDTKRPDSNSVLRIFKINDLKAYLDSIQPKDPQYINLQKALKEGEAAPGITKEETQKILKVNLERLRWKNKPKERKYVVVNIPDYRLDVMDSGRSILHMKVCVGEGRNKDFRDNIQEYDENDLKKDRPFSRETPQLNSEIHSVQVNPVWNIPESIASKEITKLAASDRFYLSSHNIDVYEMGKRVEDTEAIDWTDPAAGKKYQFKQRPGEDNSLGKIKFLFNNQSAVYLHDTPAKAAFQQSMRAVSHGCVRLEKPLDLAHVLFGDGAKYELIKKEMEDTVAVATNISLPQKVPVYLTYYTTWVDGKGMVQIRKDVYGLDIVLYSYLRKMGAV